MSDASPPPPPPQRSASAQQPLIGIEEFTMIQNQLVQEKTAKYDALEQVRRLQIELERMKEQAAQADANTKRLNGILQRSEDKQQVIQIMYENDHLKRAIQQNNLEHKAQQEALQANLTSICEDNDRLAKEVESYKKKEKELQSQLQAAISDKELLTKRLVAAASTASTNASSTPATETPSTNEQEATTATDATPSPQEGVKESNNVVIDNTALIEAQHELSIYKDELRNAQEELGKAHQEISSLKEAHERLVQESSATIKKLEGDVSRFKEELAFSHSDREIVIAKLVEKDMEIDQWKDKVRSKEKELVKKTEELSSTLEADRSALTQKLNLKEEELTKEREQLKEQLAEVTEQLKNAKTAHEENSEQRKIFEERMLKMEDLFTSKNAEVNKLKESNKNLLLEVNDKEKAQRELISLSQEQNAQLEELKKEIATANERLETIQSELETLKKEREEMIQTHEQTIKTLREEHTAQVETLTKEAKDKEEELESKISAQQQSLEESEAKLTQMQEQLEEIKKANEEAVAELEKRNEESKEKLVALETELNDTRANLKALERKNSQIVKDLQKQLQKEQLQKSKSDLTKGTPSPSGRPQRPDMPTAPVTPSRSLSAIPTSMAPKQSHSNPNLTSALAAPMAPMSPAGGNLPPSTSSTNAARATPTRSNEVELLKKDNEVLAMKLGELQTTRWQLEEKIRFLQENIVLLNDDLTKKTLIIQHYVIRKMKTGQRTTPQMDQQKGLLGALFRGAKKGEEEAKQDIHLKMSSALQETLLRNIQLQDDIATIGNEMRVLMEDNKRLKLLCALNPSEEEMKK